jgi:hypothetical protein
MDCFDSIQEQLQAVGMKMYKENQSEDGIADEIAYENVPNVLAAAIDIIRNKLGQYDLTSIEGVELRHITERLVQQHHHELLLYQQGTIQRGENIIRPHLEVVHQWLLSFGIYAMKVPIDQCLTGKQTLDWRASPEMQEYFHFIRIKANETCGNMKDN